MTDEPGLQVPTGSSGDAAAPVHPVRSTAASWEPTADRPDYRQLLRSRRWRAAPLRNPEAEKTDPRIVVAFIAALCTVTFLVLVAGYWTGFWG